MSVLGTHYALNLVYYIHIMINRVREKKKAMRLRKKGYTYNEILKEVNVAKSSLSLWLKDMPLTKQEKDILRKRKDANISRGRIRAGAAHHLARLERDKILFQEAKEEFERFKYDPLFQMGVGLYWAEGAKRNDRFAFANSDPDMINVMIRWIEEYLGLERRDIFVRLFIHKPYREENCEGFWSEKIGVDLSHFKKTVYKPTGLGIKKRPSYKGCLRIELGKVNYLRKVKFWQQLLIMHYQKR
tara:strand:- start:15314 stop:16042 length:729 start_codon:yes stop_codon:yes gene_type:complete